MATSAMISSIAMAFSVTFTFLVAVLVIFLYVHSHYYGIERFSTRRRGEARRNHFIFEAGDPSNSSIGLNPSILFSLPISVYRSSDFKEGLECAVCLSELADGEKARLLPNCSHGFHLECIDMWLHSHSTCPLCRCPVGGEDDGLHRSESASLDIERSDLNGGRMLAISIPDRSTEIFQSSLPPISPIGSQLGERKSPVEDSGSPARLNVGSLKRILSGRKMIGGSCCSSAVVGDIEQGLAGYEEGS